VDFARQARVAVNRHADAAKICEQIFHIIRLKSIAKEPLRHLNTKSHGNA
jgi:hypothetical protein